MNLKKTKERRMRTVCLSRLACIGIVLAACANPTAPEPTQAGEPHPLCKRTESLCTVPVSEVPTLGPTLQIAPSELLPSEVASQVSHNNLDVIMFGDRLFLAFRTAPDHFASADTVLYVVSTLDMASWRFEGAFTEGTDLREPQLVVVGETLRFYYALLGDNPLAFEPQGSRVTTYLGPGEWSDPMPIFENDFIPWRMKPRGESLYMTGYTGGQSIYSQDGEVIQVHWLKSNDGLTWEPAQPAQPIVLEGGVSETDVTWLEDGSVVAVSRNEAGDETGFGMKVCRAEASDLGTWSCVPDPKKYDSPLLFTHENRVYLIGRRNLTATGHYDVSDPGDSLEDRYLDNQAAYWQAPKACALWEINAETLKVEYVLDLPSRGDTCFPELIRLDAHRYLIFNYTSPLDSDEPITWLEGQMGPTHIVAHVLSLP